MSTIKIDDSYLEDKNDVEWKDFPVTPHFNNAYEICNYGLIRNKKTKKYPVILKSSTGYFAISLDVGNKNVPGTDKLERYKKTFDIHVHVANAFIDPKPNKEGFKNVVKIIKKNNTLYDLYYKNLERSYQSKYDENNEKENRLKLIYIYTTTNINEINNNITNNKIIIDKNKEKQKEINNKYDDYKYEDKIITINNICGKKLKKFPNYIISNNGKVYDLGGKEIAQVDKNSKYIYYKLFNGIEKKNYHAHKLVAALYIQNPNKYDEVDHINADPKNNDVSNLRWCTHSQNMKYNADLRQVGKKVNQIDITTEQVIKIFNSIEEARIAVGLKDGTSIGKCINGKQKTAGKDIKYMWSYVEN